MIALASGHVRPIVEPGGAELVVTSNIRSLVYQRLSREGYRVSLVPIELTNSDRVSFAESIGADIYISIECQTDPRAGWTSMDGVSIIAPRRSDSLAREIAAAFGELVPLRLRGGTGIRYQEDLFITKRLPQCHVITINCGFLSNKYDTEVLRSSDGQQRIAVAICAGVFPWAS